MDNRMLRYRQDELDGFAQKHGWVRGRYGSWRAGRLTVSVILRPLEFPSVKFVAVERASGEEREFAELEDVERLVDYVRMFGTLPARADSGQDGRVEPRA